jgi:hypothetical protein
MEVILRGETAIQDLPLQIFIIDYLTSSVFPFPFCLFFSISSSSDLSHFRYSLQIVSTSSVSLFPSVSSFPSPLLLFHPTSDLHYRLSHFFSFPFPFLSLLFQVLFFLSIALQIFIIDYLTFSFPLLSLHCYKP